MYYFGSKFEMGRFHGLSDFPEADGFVFYCLGLGISLLCCLLTFI